MKQIFTLIILFSFLNGINAQLIAPDFSITDTNGNTYTLYEELNKGKTIVLDFFGLQCGSCQSDMGVLELVWQNHGAGSGDVWVWAYETYGGSDYEVNDFVTINGGTFPSFSLSAEDSLIKKYHVNYVPSYFIICPNGYMKSCPITDIEQYISACATLDIDETIMEKNQLTSIFSVPGNSHIEVNFSIVKNAKISIELYDLLGNRIDGKTNFYQLGSNQMKMNRAGISSGYYFIRMTDNRHFMDTKRIVIN
jgi:hypothetical protein